ncbi:MAG TPA: nuclear transport factor 2 family protein [Puia sp.]|nr:nuclear transport factor 2 family protein [Puia sp.]
MKKILLVLAVLLYSAITFAQSGDQQTLKQLNEDWIHAYPTKDTATMSKIFADDIIMITPNGSKIGKKIMLSRTASPDQQIISANVDSVDVRLLGANVGLIMAYVSFVSKAGDKEIAGKNCYLDVYEKRNGKWLAVAAHVTLLNFK